MRTTGRSTSKIYLATVVVALLLTACGDDEAAPDAAGDPAPIEAAHEGDADATAAFCDAAPDPSAEVAESYVGSAEHLGDLQRVRDVAPDDLVDDLDAVISHFEDGVDPADPETQVMENFPEEVDEAIRRVIAFTEEHCGA